MLPSLFVAIVFPAAAFVNEQFFDAMNTYHFELAESKMPIKVSFNGSETPRVRKKLNTDESEKSNQKFNSSASFFRFY